jgi:hypothetical protein
MAAPTVLGDFGEIVGTIIEGKSPLIDQADRQDVRHVRILILCTREFLADALSAAQSGMISERAAINALEEVRTILLSREASRASKSSMLELRDCWPVQALERSSLPKVDRFWRNRLAPML